MEILTISDIEKIMHFVPNNEIVIFKKNGAEYGRAHVESQEPFRIGLNYKNYGREGL